MENDLENWLARIKGCGFVINFIDFTDRQAIYSTNHHRKFSMEDTGRAILTELANDDKHPSNHRAMAYRKLAQLDPVSRTENLKHANLMNLRFLKQNGAKRVRIITQWTACEYCALLRGKTLDIDEAISQQLIPGDCTHESGCSCTYADAD
jgi:hypothetical protein